MEKNIENRVEEWKENEPKTIADVRKAIERLKNTRSSVTDNIIAELHKIKQQTIEATIHKIVRQI